MASSKPLEIQLEEQIWHPHIGWQVLRRSKRYQEAVKRFKQSAIALEGPDGLGCYALTYAGIDAPYIKDDRTKFIEAGSQTPLRVRMGQENIEDMLFVGDWEIAPKFEQAMATDYCKKFVDEFGYVLRFPIEPEVENPNPAFLNYLWRMYPAAEYSSDDLVRLKKQFNFEKEGLTDLHLLIDWNFSDDIIRRNLDGLIKETLKRRPSKKSYPKKYRDPDIFNESITTFDLRAKEVSWRNIGEHLWGDKGHHPEKLIDDAKARLTSISELIEIFEKEAERRLKG